jgi:hypothetical protein
MIQEPGKPAVPFRTSVCEIERVSADGLNITGTRVKVQPRIELDVPESGELNLYLFYVHEEGLNLFLFCKYQTDDQFHSVCIQIAMVFYCLQFLPTSEEVVPKLLDEVRGVTGQKNVPCRSLIWTFKL